MLKEDYVSRSIRDAVRALAKLVLNKDNIEYIVPAGLAVSPLQKFYADELALVDAGEINQAENLLLDELDKGGEERFEMAMAFYLHVNEKSDDFLDEHNYSREEIITGIQDTAASFGYSYDVGFLSGQVF